MINDLVTTVLAFSNAVLRFGLLSTFVTVDVGKYYALSFIIYHVYNSSLQVRKQLITF